MKTLNICDIAVIENQLPVLLITIVKSVENN